MVGLFLPLFARLRSLMYNEGTEDPPPTSLSPSLSFSHPSIVRPSGPSKPAFKNGNVFYLASRRTHHIVGHAVRAQHTKNNRGRIIEEITAICFNFDASPVSSPSCKRRCATAAVVTKRCSVETYPSLSRAQHLMHTCVSVILPLARSRARKPGCLMRLTNTHTTFGTDEPRRLDPPAFGVFSPYMDSPSAVPS